MNDNTKKELEELNSIPGFAAFCIVSFVAIVSFFLWLIK